MSGGSLGYLCSKETCDLSLCSCQENLEEVEQTLLSLGYKDIARDVRRLIEYVRSAENRIEVLYKQLNDVFYAGEWWDSADIGKETMIKYLEKYRQGEG